MQHDSPDHEVDALELNRMWANIQGYMQRHPPEPDTLHSIARIRWVIAAAATIVLASGLLAAVTLTTSKHASALFADALSQRGTVHSKPSGGYQ
jgi:hypothetical protein